MINIILDSDEVTSPVFILHASLLIPKVSIQPTVEDVQDVLIITGKNITSVAKGVGQWTCGKPPVRIIAQIFITIKSK